MHRPKTSQKYFAVDPWVIGEAGFDPEKARLSESVFALANEFMCVRGYFEEGYSGEHLLGSYFNQLYDYLDFKYPQVFKGFVSKGATMPNAVDWLYTRIWLDGELLDLAMSSFSEFKRETDMRTASLRREFVWKTHSGKELKVTFSRFLSAPHTAVGYQRVTFEPLNFSGEVQVVSGLDFNTIYEIAGGWDQTKSGGANKEKSGDLSFWTCEKSGREGSLYAIQARTRRSGMRLFSSFSIDSPQVLSLKEVNKREEKFIGTEFALKLEKGKETHFDKIAVNHWEMAGGENEVWSNGMNLAAQYAGSTYDGEFKEHCDFWKDAWNRMDIRIDGDPEIQQGVRFSLLMTYMNYHGEDEHKNMLCKLAGEVYNGTNFWDTEIYCHRMYMFINPKAARNMLMYRYHYLPLALQEAKRVDLDGARFPFCTVSGVDDSGCWQHCDLEIHQNVAIFYAIWHHEKIVGDKAFLYREGIEMLLQMCRCMASWGGWSPKRGDFGFYGVMGPDEFHMMVSNNCYTNVMGKKMFDYTVSVLEEMKREAPELYRTAVQKTDLKPDEPAEWKRMADHMRIPKDEQTGIYEQFDGYFDLPHVDVANFPTSDIPVYKNWAYIRIFRNNMIKQPDFLNLPFYFSSDYTLEEKRANYEFYEERTIHESSLSPSLHGILAAELGKLEDAYDFLAYAARLDLDNYNHNTDQGIHATASAGVWAGMVQGFGGMRTDGERLSFAPSIPKNWISYSFRVLYQGALIEVNVDQSDASLKIVEGSNVVVAIYGKIQTVTRTGATIRFGDRET